MDPLGLAAFVTKQEYKGQDIYNYIALGRGGELSHNLLGFIPGAGFVNWLARNTGGIAEITGKDWKDYIIESGSNLSDLASMTKHFKSIPHSSKISEAADKVSTGLNLTNLVLFMSDTEFIRDQLVGQIGGLHMAASTKEGVIVKYGYLRDRIDELIESKELTYSCSFFGLGFEKEAKTSIWSKIGTAVKNFFSGKGYKTDSQINIENRNKLASGVGNNSTVASAQASLVMMDFDLGKGHGKMELMVILVVRQKKH